MMKANHIFGTMIDRKTGTHINLGELHNVRVTSPTGLQIPMPQTAASCSKYSASALMQELNRRKQAAREAVLQAAAEKAERDKQRLRAEMSEDAILGITFVPFVIAEVAWDYADTLLDLAVMMRLRETRKLCRSIKELRQEYDHKRFQIIDNDWREVETKNMIGFQEELSDFFGDAYRSIKDALKQTYNDLNEDSLMLIASSYLCRIVIKGLKRYTEAQEKVVAAVLGYEIEAIMPKQLDRLNILVTEFAGDSPLPEAYNAKLAAYAEDLAKYINDVEFTSDDDKKKSTPKQQTTMTNEELFAEIKSVINGLLPNMELNVNGNKAAGVRARKATLKLEKLMKQYRKQSVK